MRVHIDECVDPRVKLLFREHESATVHDKGWGAFEDRLLLTLAQKEFDVFVTIDGGLEVLANERARPGEAIHVRTSPV
jgi:predicted nuclease of predicted toxin-antitoxin system